LNSRPPAYETSALAS